MNRTSARPLGRLELFIGKDKFVQLLNIKDNKFPAPAQQVLLYAGKPIILGRLESQCSWILRDPAISNVHLKVYSIEYDGDGRIEPLIFAEDLSNNGTAWNDRRLTRGRGAVLLSDGDRLTLNPRVNLIYRSQVPSNDRLLFSREICRDIHAFRHQYRLMNRLIGEGAGGKVVVAIQLRLGKQRACKIIDISALRSKEVQLTEKLLDQRRPAMRSHTMIAECREFRKQRQDEIERKVAKLYREVDILRDLCHPNIIRLEKVYHSPDALYIFSELMAGGDLYSFVRDQGGKLDEASTGLICKQLFEAVKHLHDKNIVHRDIKLENVLVATRSELPRVVLTDFGQATVLQSASNSSPKCTSSLTGTYCYAAPELKAHRPANGARAYTKAVDMWALGCLTYCLMVGYHPFSFSSQCASRAETRGTQSDDDTYENQLGTIWEGTGVSAQPKDLVRHLLVVDEKSRMTAEQALNHHWFTNETLKDILEIVYQNAIAGWQEHPRFRSNPVVEQIKPADDLPAGPLAALRSQSMGRYPSAGQPIGPHYRELSDGIKRLYNRQPSAQPRDKRCKEAKKFDGFPKRMFREGRKAQPIESKAPQSGSLHKQQAVLRQLHDKVRRGAVDTRRRNKSTEAREVRPAESEAMQSCQKIVGRNAAGVKQREEPEGACKIWTNGSGQPAGLGRRLCDRYRIGGGDAAGVREQEEVEEARKLRPLDSEAPRPVSFNTHPAAYRDLCDEHKNVERDVASSKQPRSDFNDADPVLEATGHSTDISTLTPPPPPSPFVKPRAGCFAMLAAGVPPGTDNATCGRAAEQNTSRKRRLSSGPQEPTLQLEKKPKKEEGEE